MNWDDLRFVLAVARSGSLSRAASRLRVDQTTVGRRLSALEADIGQALFFRNKRGFVPTEAGENAIAEIEKMERAADQVTQRAKRERFDLVGQVRITTMPWILEHLLVPRLGRLWSKHPQIEIQGIADLHERASTLRETELSLRFELPARVSEREEVVGQLPYSVYGRRGTDPDNLPWAGSVIMFGQFAPQTWLDQQLEKSGEVALFRSDDAGIVAAAVRAGLVKALLPDLLAEQDPMLEKVERYETGVTRKLKLQLHPHVAEIARVQAVIDWLKSIFD